MAFKFSSKFVNLQFEITLIVNRGKPFFRNNVHDSLLFLSGLQITFNINQLTISQYS
jgi:hypothetical protein